MLRRGDGVGNPVARHVAFAARMQMARQHNRADSITYPAVRLHRPHSNDELSRIVGSATKARVLGARHSRNGIADTAGN
jgi:hypothetical protein